MFLSSLVFSPLVFSQDPMQPPVWSAERTQSKPINTRQFNLQQIISSKHRSVAVINNTSLLEGQVINGAKVTKITSQWVKLQYKGHSFNLTMTNPDMTTTTKEYHSEK